MGGSRCVWTIAMCVGMLALDAGVSSARAQIGQHGEPPQIPSNIQVPESFRPIMTNLLAKSPTLRRQCASIAAARHARVTVHLLPRAIPSRARARIRRYKAGLLRADVEIPAAGNHAELLAHELEHVAEQIEGVNLARMALLRSDQVRRLNDGSFDTLRAHDAGRAAAREVDALGPPALRAVGRALARLGRATWAALANRE